MGYVIFNCDIEHSKFYKISLFVVKVLWIPRFKPISEFCHDCVNFFFRAFLVWHFLQKKNILLSELPKMG